MLRLHHVLAVFGCFPGATGTTCSNGCVSNGHHNCHCDCYNDNLGSDCNGRNSGCVRGTACPVGDSFCCETNGCGPGYHSPSANGCDRDMIMGVGRYVLICDPGEIQVAEVRVWGAGGVQLAPKRAEMRDVYCCGAFPDCQGDAPQWTPAKTIDGNDATFAHSETTDTRNSCYRGKLPPNTWLRIDLGADVAVTKIEVLDRPDLAGIPGGYVGRKSPLATKNLLEVTDGLRRPP